MRTEFRKTDLGIILGAVALIAVLILALRVTAARAGAAAEATVRISVGGEVIGEYPLSEDREVAVDTERGHNLVRIEGGEVRVVEADCPDGYCMKQGASGTGGRPIICLPHRVVIEIVGGEEPEVDTVT